MLRPLQDCSLSNHRLYMTKRSRNPEKLQAYARIRAMERPEGMSQRQWAGVRQFLYAIARHYPRAYPGQELLAEEMGVDVSTIQRYVRLARHHGLLTVLPNAGIKTRRGITKTNQYLINDPSLRGVKDPSLRGPKYQDSLTGTLTSQNKAPTVQKPTVSTPTMRGGCAAAEESVKKKPSQEEINAVYGTRVIKRVPRSQDRDPARRLAGYFKEQWDILCEDRPRLREGRDVDSIKEATGYIRSTFLRPAEGRVYTEEEVRGFIDDFMTSIRRGTLIKPGQSAWKKFTGAWGRRTVARHDPAASRKYFEESR